MEDKPRLSKEAWLEKSLEILAVEGARKLTIDHLVKAMGVTKGSFYWHFKTRADFIICLVEYWADTHTQSLVKELGSISDPAKRLLKLMQILSEKNHSQFDISIMNWGEYESVAKKKVQAVFDTRMEFLRSVFREIGFKGDELEMRVHTMVFFQTLECCQYTKLSKANRLDYVKLRHKMLITP